jgi:hypothetical protein
MFAPVNGQDRAGGFGISLHGPLRKANPEPTVRPRRLPFESPTDPLLDGRGLKS